MSHVHQLTIQGLSAWQLENRSLRVTVIPALGGKIVSLFDRLASYEWLVGPMRPLQPAAYGSRFVEQDMSGWDEMFPTIDACPYPREGPYQGRPLPDHGEVWSLPWEWVAGPPSERDEALHLHVQGRQLPYRLERRLSLPEEGHLRLEYRVENLGEEELIGLWAAHPQFTSEAGSTVLLPASVSEVLNVIASERWGEVGRRLRWPNAVTSNGEKVDLEQAQLGPVGSCRKFYLPPESPVSWVRLVRPRAESWLQLEWQVEQIPYLGLWFDEGAYNRTPAVALEPSNGFYDRLDLAWQNGRCLRLPPGGSLTWELQVRVGF